MRKTNAKAAAGSKLRSMTEISAAEAVKLFHAAMCLDPDDPISLYAPIPEGFPDDVQAKDFLDYLKIYRDMVSEGEASGAAAYGPAHLDDFGTQLAHLREMENDADEQPALKEEWKKRLGTLTEMESIVYEVFISRRNEPLKALCDDKRIIDASRNRKKLAYKTIKQHLTTICLKLGVSDKKELAVKAHTQRPAT